MADSSWSIKKLFFFAQNVCNINLFDLSEGHPGVYG